ncbi:hypothetical protein SDC9_98206 [bioreactor metagenome]|uniref:Zinc-ribbon domain-containing protein n=1 Tax=bioreactor metagenome TaxID=1076179 RepID=A0A645AEK6_9ZZZZ
MPFCDNCGKPTYPLDTVCSNCGAPVKQPAPPVYTPAPASVPASDVEPQQGSPFAVLSSWSFVGSLLLMAIPIAGFIIAIVWAAGSTGNLNRRNLARANLILMGIGIALYIVVVIAALALGGSAFLLNDLVQ